MSGSALSGTGGQVRASGVNAGLTRQDACAFDPAVVGSLERVTTNLP